MGYEKTESKLRALAAQREAERWRDCPTPGCRLEEGHDGLHRFVPEVVRLREEVERLDAQMRSMHTGAECEAAVARAREEGRAEGTSALAAASMVAALRARAEAAERKLINVIECEGVTAHRVLLDSLAASEARERGLREACEVVVRYAVDTMSGRDSESRLRALTRYTVHTLRSALSGSSPAPSGDANRNVAPIQWLGDATQDGDIWELMRRRDRFFILGGPTRLYFKSDNGTHIVIQPGWWIYDWHTDHPQVSSAAPDSSGDVHRDDGQGYRKEEDHG